MSPLTLALAALALAGVVGFVFAILWIVAQSRLSRQRRRRVVATEDAAELRLSLDEQTARLRIVRELSEVVIHSVSSTITQVDAAVYSSEADASAAVRALSSVGETARASLADIRRVVTVAHEGEAHAGPQPEPASTRAILEAMRDAGLVIEVEESGERFELQPGASRAVARILEEALTNALKFGGDGTHVAVSFAWTSDGLQLKVDDDGVKARLRRAGLDPNEVAQRREYSIDDDLGALTEEHVGAGMTAMRERAALFGGVMHTTSHPGVGFSVSVAFAGLRHHNGVHGVRLDS